ncbi:50S ribosomal protein L17 [Robiginitalea sp. SC105]|nr:50S ribosomal protein L17 [Robiginitalea sp. SC105]
MRHGKKVNHLGRKTAHRKAMLANMACSLIEHKRINTTVAKAKALKQFVEPLITKSKAENNQSAEKGTHNRRIVMSSLRSKEAVSELFSSVAEKVGDRAGGYTRIIKLGNRLGDNADMAMIELVDFNELYNADKPKKKSTRRSRRSKSKDTEASAAPAAKEAKATGETKAAEEAPAAEQAEEPKETKPAEAAPAAETAAEAKETGNPEEAPEENDQKADGSKE